VAPAHVLVGGPAPGTSRDTMRLPYSTLLRNEP